MWVSIRIIRCKVQVVKLFYDQTMMKYNVVDTKNVDCFQDNKIFSSHNKYGEKQNKQKMIDFSNKLYVLSSVKS